MLTRKHSSTFLWLAAVFRFSFVFFQCWDSHLQCKALLKNDLKANCITRKNFSDDFNFGQKSTGKRNRPKFLSVRNI